MSYKYCIIRRFVSKKIDNNSLYTELLVYPYSDKQELLKLAKEYDVCDIQMNPNMSHISMTGWYYTGPAGEKWAQEGFPQNYLMYDLHNPSILLLSNKRLIH